MKILYCLAGTFNSGGMERIVISKANWLAQHGYEISIVTSEQNGKPDYFAVDYRIKRIDLDICYSDTNGLNPIKKFLVRSKKLKKHKHKLKDIIHKSNPDIIISTCGNEVGIIPTIKHHSKKIAEIHFSRWYRLQLNRTGVWKLIDLFLTWQDKKILSKYDKFITLTEEDKLNWGNQKNLVVIPNFINICASRATTLENKSMIAVGRLSYQKGYDQMIKAWYIVSQKYPDWHLNIYGGGELKNEIISLIKSLKLSSKISIYPPTNHIEEEYRKNSALLLSSRYEGLPMVLLEAMAFGLPPIAFACQCGPKDIIKNNKNGLIIESGNIEAFAAAICKLIEKEAFRKDLGAQAFKDIKNYTEKNIMREWDNLFTSL